MAEQSLQRASSLDVSSLASTGKPTQGSLLMDRETFQKVHGIIGQSLEIKEIVGVIMQVAPTDITVLLTGESGTGKEVFASAIHKASTRANMPMITVNCGAIPEGIIESELFGHEKGAFTGATETRKGYFELADGGTIFLDEIGELPLGTQVKFLRVLENGEFMRVGSAIARKVNVRVIAATNKDLDYEVRAKRFRPDLYYRLRSVDLHIPPLRERREDIPLFFQKFADDFCERNKISFTGITDEAMSVLMNYHWPGNVRELKNTVESMLVLEANKKIDAETVRKYLREYQQGPLERNLPVYVSRPSDQAERELIYRALVDLKSDILELKNLLLHRSAVRPPVAPFEVAEAHDVSGISAQGGEEENLSLEEMERRLITEALEKYRGNRRLAAKALKISERTLYRKIKEYGLGGRY